MRQVLQDMRRGGTTVCEAPAPVASRGTVLIHSSVSLISAGTERMLVGFGKASLLDKALQQPERVKMVLQKVRTDGLLSTFDAVQSKLDQPLRSLRAEGESVYALGDLRGAIDRLRAGQRVARPGNPSDFIEVSVIDARLRDIQGQLRALMLEQQEQQR